MKFKPTHAFAAVALAIAGQAGAQAITNGPATGNSSFYFVGLDDVAGRSYFAEMVANAGSTTVGVLRLEDVLTNPNGSWTISLSGLNTFAAASAPGNFFGGFGAADSDAALGGGTTAATGNRRILTSISTDAAAPIYNNSQTVSSGANTVAFFNQVNGVCAASPCTATTTSDQAYAGIQAGSAGLGTQWGLPAGPSNGDSFTGTIAWDLFLVATASTQGIGAATVTQLTALHAVLDLATNTLSISGPVSAVPVPAAVYLFGSAILGLFGIGRRKKGSLAGDALVAA